MRFALRTTTLLVILFSIFNSDLVAQFKITIKTDNNGTSGDTEFTIPTNPTLNGDYNYNIDWHDDGIIDEYGVTGDITFDYERTGTFEIAIYETAAGSFPAIYFDDSGDKEKLISINQWGDISWQTMGHAFYGCSNMTYEATDMPDLSSVTSMLRMFRGCSSFDGDISGWDVSTVEILRAVFNGASVFNQDISSWDLSTANNTTNMFTEAVAFNQGISGWDVSNVSLMEGMFNGATSFDQNLGNWNISSVTNMNNIFNFSGMSTRNYDQTLIGWESQNEPTGIIFGANILTYCEAESERSTLITTSGWTIDDNGSDCSTELFKLTIKTDNSGTSSNTSFTIPTNGAGYNYSIDWDNDGSFDDTGITTDITHDFTVSGTYQIGIGGDFPTIYFNEGGDRLKVLSIDQWGNIEWTSFTDSFRGCTNLTYAATDTPVLSSVTGLQRMFQDCTNFNGDVSEWDVSNISTMQGMFRGATNFNQDISNWDVSSVSNFGSLLRDCSSFDQPLDTWTFGINPSFSNMLNNSGLSTSNYDGLLDALADQGITNKALGANGLTYCNAEDSRETLINDMNWTITDGGKDCMSDPLLYFKFTVKTQNAGTSCNSCFQIPITGSGYNYSVDWESDGTFDLVDQTGSLPAHDYTTEGSYQISIVGDFPRIYFNDSGDKKKLFSIDQWGTNKWSSMAYAFYGCSNVRYYATDSPDLSNVTTTARMFSGCEKLNGDMSDWDVSNLTNMSRMFQNATIFNQDISTWNVSSVTTMAYMFNNAVAFNQDIGDWDVSSATNLRSMFSGASLFDQYLGGWNIESVSNFANMLDNTDLSTINYDDTLIGWEGQNVQSNQTLGASNLAYCGALSSRNELINTNGWTINGDVFYCYELPVELLDFWPEYSIKEGKIKLNWSTSSEISNDRFELSRSGDGRNFDKIAIVKGNGTVNHVSNYTFTDENPAPGKNYYRLTQYDFDGTMEHLDIVAVEHMAVNNNITIYPNPNTGEHYLFIKNNNNERIDTESVQLHNQSGRKIEVPLIELPSGYKVDLNEVKCGVYILNMLIGGEQKSFRILKF